MMPKAPIPRRLTAPLAAGPAAASMVALTTVLATVLIAALAGAPAAAQIAQQPTNLPTLPVPAGSQFAPFQPAPYNLDTVQGEWVNLETQLIRPILVTRDGQHVVVANEADDRVVVYDPDLTAIEAEVVLGQGIATLAQRPPSSDGADDPAEIWVSVRHQTSVAVIDTRTWRVKALLRPPIPDSASGSRRADTPGGIAFNADGTKAYVAATSTDKLVVYDAVTKGWLKNISLTLTHNGQQTALNDPMAVLAQGGLIWVASHLSGNQTLADTVTASPIPTLPNTFGPLSILIRDLDDDPARSLPDFDLMAVDPVTDQVVSHQSGVGTTLFGLTFHPPSGRLVVSNFEARNGEFLGEGSFPAGQVVHNRITGLTPGAPPASYIHVNTENLGPDGDDIVMPTDMVVDGLGRLFVAGYASANIGVFAADGAYLGSMAAGSGPRGLDLARERQRLYVLNRAEATVAYYDLSGALPDGPARTIALPDPTYDRVKQGRQIFLQPSHSGVGTTGCFSCHHDLRKDGLGWQLSKFFEMDDGFTNEQPPTFWRDLKGVMVTQDLRSLADAAPYHWRGEQKDLEDFNGAFVGLLKAPSPLSAEDFARMKDYILSAVYPPNPFQPMNRVYSDTALDGFAVYASACNQCHLLPTGTDSSTTEGIFGFTLGPTPVTVKTAQLRGNWTKQSPLANVDDANPPSEATTWPSTGFGFFHEGTLDSLQQFLDFFFPGFTQDQRDDTRDFVRQLDTGMPPFAGYSALLDQDTAGANLIEPYMIDQADSGNGDLVARGRLRLAGVWQDVGLLWNPRGQVFIPDLTPLGNFSWPTLESLAAAGDAELLFLGVPTWSGERIGLDRDRDGDFDGDELAAGQDPRNPDTDGDGLWDSYDPQPLSSQPSILTVAAPRVLDTSVRVVFDTTNMVKIVYETDTFSPSRVEFGPTAAYGFTSGDPFPLPTFQNNRTNLWKRHHTVYLRPQPGQGLLGLEDGISYHFRIHTQGQNNRFGMTDDFETADFKNGLPIEADQQDPNLRLASLGVTSLRNGSQVTYTATATLTDNHGNPAPNVTVKGRFTYYTGTAIAGQEEFTNVTSDSQGVLVYTGTSSTQAAGDLTLFDVPMERPISGENDFHWPEGPNSMEVTAP